VKIAILGAESTGKSTLAAALQRELGGAVVPEMLRDWVNAVRRTPRKEEQRSIFSLQVAKEKQIVASGTTPVFCDTTPLSIAIASIHYFNDDSLMRDAIAHQRTYDYALVCMPSFPWVADGLQRDSPQMQDRFHAALLDVLDNNGIAYTRVAGEGAARESRAIAAVQWWLES
jgi:nicotinamide riboside kinase